MLLMFALATPVGPTSGRCITQLAMMSMRPKYIDLTADVCRIIYTVYIVYFVCMLKSVYRMKCI